MATPNDRDKKVALTLYDRPGNEVWLGDIQQGIAAYREEIEARAPEQGGEMREALERSTYHLRRLLPQCGKQDMNNHERDLVEWCEVDVPAIIARESAEPAEKRRQEVDALLWMAEHVMGTDSAETMRGWLARYRADGRLVIRDIAGAEIEHYPEEVAR